MPAWDKATPVELNGYTAALHERLQAVQCSGSLLLCQDPQCKDSSHTEQKDSMVLDLLMAVAETSYPSLPLTGRAGSGRDRDSRDIIPGWNEEVKPRRLKANFFYRTWLAAGKPRHGKEHEDKLYSQTQYRYAICRVKRASKLHQAQGLFGAAMAGDIELFKEM